MFIDKFKKEDGYYYLDECYYEDAESLISIGVLGFCGCGMPGDALEYVRSALQLVNDLKKIAWGDRSAYKQWEKRKRKLFADDGAEYFMWYFLDDKGLTEHGTSVPGWLTDKGVELLSYLNELRNK